VRRLVKKGRWRGWTWIDRLNAPSTQLAVLTLEIVLFVAPCLLNWDVTMLDSTEQDASTVMTNPPWLPYCAFRNAVQLWSPAVHGLG